MINRGNRGFVKVQLLETQRMLRAVGNHPLMSFSLQQKEKQLLDELDSIPVDQKDTKVILLFNGNSVNGSIGIDAAFAGKVVVPFQNMVTSEFGHRVHGSVGKRGKLNFKNESRLFLTALPRGSFGVELSKLENENQTEENQLADALSHITKLVESSSKSDEAFAAGLDDVTPRTIQSLKEFFKIIADDKAGVSIQSGGIKCELNPSQVKSAYERVSGTKTWETTETMAGVLKGMLVDSGKFDFTDDFGNAITGTIDKALTKDEVSKYVLTYFKRPCTAVLKVEKVLFKNGREKVSYTLLSIEP